MTDDLHAAIQADLAQEALHAAPAWRPISTAPRDGTEIIVCGRYDEPCVVRWFAHRNEWQGSFQGWAAIESQGDLHTDYYTAGPVSHWMPMPVPPNFNDEDTP